MWVRNLDRAKGTACFCSMMSMASAGITQSLDDSANIGWNHLETSSLTCMALELEWLEAGPVNQWAYLYVGFKEQKIPRGNVLKKKSPRGHSRRYKTFSDLVQKSVTKSIDWTAFYWLQAVARMSKDARGELGYKPWLQKSIWDGMYCCSHLWKYHLPMEEAFGLISHEELHREYRPYLGAVPVRGKGAGLLIPTHSCVIGHRLPWENINIQTLLSLFECRKAVWGSPVIMCVTETQVLALGMESMREQMYIKLERDPRWYGLSWSFSAAVTKYHRLGGL